MIYQLKKPTKEQLYRFLSDIYQKPVFPQTVLGKSTRKDSKIFYKKEDYVNWFTENKKTIGLILETKLTGGMGEGFIVTYENLESDVTAEEIVKKLDWDLRCVI